MYNVQDSTSLEAPTGNSEQAGLRRLRKAVDSGDAHAAELMRGRVFETSRRRKLLSFSHHAEVASLPPAEARIATEYDAAQERGEVEKAGGDRKSINVRAPDNDRPATMHLENEATWTPEFKAAAKLSELGLDRRRLNEWRKTAEAGEDVVRQAVKPPCPVRPP